MDYGRTKSAPFDDSWKFQNEEELLIFGYSCKLFRDDEKAASLENGEHLIPWMGDSTLMIDRFDVRGALYDLSESESKGRPPEEVLTEAELKEEEICDQERYFALYHNEDQLQIAAEEEAKRLQVELASDGSLYNQVAFNYSQYDNATCESESKEPQPPLTAPVIEPTQYMPPADEDFFIPPPELNIPLYMEVPKSIKQNKIIIKTAKFVVSQGAQMEIIIKTKQSDNTMFNFLAFDNPLNAYYKHVVALIRNGRYRWEDDCDGGSERSDQYLHPNLSQSQPRLLPDLTPGVLSSPARPSPHCSYSKLITKIREKQKASSVPFEEAELPSSSSPVLPSSPLPAAPLPASASTPQDPPPLPALLTPQPRGTMTQGPLLSLVDYPSFNTTADGNSDGEDSEPRKATRTTPRDYRHIKWPPPDIQMVIDKMASYITKNGAAFEDVVKSREDPRFDFLNKSHEYYPYYKCKMQLYNEVYGDIFKNPSKSHEWKKRSTSNCGSSGVSSSKKSEVAKNSSSRTISFSIKSREQEVSLTSRTTFPIESSTSEEDEDLEEDERERRRMERAQRRLARKQREEREKKEREKLRRKEEEVEEKKERKATAEDDSGNEDLYDIFKYAQEMERDESPSRVQSSQQAQSESPDEASSKQEERKKKAAAFLSKLKDDKKPPIYGPQMHPEMAASFLQSEKLSPPSLQRSVEVKAETPPPLPLPPPPPVDPPQQTPPPLPKSPSPSSLFDIMNSFELEKSKAAFARDVSSSPKRSKTTPEKPVTLASVLCGISESQVKQGGERVSEATETHSRKSRSHKKHSRQKSASRSPSGRRERKKRKRSRGGTSHRRKKRRSRSRSGAYSKSSRSSHKKKPSKHHSSHREKEKMRKKKHKKQRSPSVSSLPSSESSSPSTPSTLPSETESDMDIQVIESDEKNRSSGSSSVVSLPSTSSVSRNSDKKLSSEVAVDAEESKLPSRLEISSNGAEQNSPLSVTVNQPSFGGHPKYARSFLTAIENSNSSDGPPPETEKKPLFNPNASSAMAKIAQGLRAKLHAMLEKESKIE